MLPRYKETIFGQVPRIEEAFDSRNLLPSTALDPKKKLIFVAIKSKKYLQREKKQRTITKRIKI